MAEIIDVTIWAEAADDGAAWWGINGLALGADGDFAIVADADTGLLAPDKRPPGTGWGGAQNGMLLGKRLLVSGEWGGAQFAVDFVLVGVGEELVQELVGTSEIADLIGGEYRREAFLPVVMAAFDFAFGLGSWGIEQFNAIEVEGLAELGEGVGIMGVEEGMEVDIEGQGQAMDLEDAGEEIEVGEEGFAVIETSAGVEAGGVVEDVEESLFVVGAGQPGVRAGVVLPKGTAVTGLPAFDGLAWGFVTGIWGELVGDGPAADTGAVGFKVETAEQFTGDGTVGTRRFYGEQFGGQSDRFSRPVGVMIATGEAGRPRIGATLGAGGQILGAELVVAAQADAQFEGDGGWCDLAGAGLSEEMADQRRGKPVSELEFFIAPRVSEKWILRIGTDTGRSWPGCPKAARPAVYQTGIGAQVASPQSPILRSSNQGAYKSSTRRQEAQSIIPTLIAQPFPVLIAQRHAKFEHPQEDGQSQWASMGAMASAVR